jgi:hypothetical protein
MTYALVDYETPALPPLDEATARALSDRLYALAAEHGISQLRFASSGRLVGHIAEDRDSIDTAAFEVAVQDTLGYSAGLFSDRVLSKPRVSPDLVAARPL